MRVRFHIPGPLRPHTSGRSPVELDVPGATIADALAALWQTHPGLRDRVLTEQGEVRQHVNIFVGEESIRYCGGLGAALPDDADITILPAVSGG